MGALPMGGGAEPLVAETLKPRLLLRLAALRDGGEPLAAGEAFRDSGEPLGAGDAFREEIELRGVMSPACTRSLVRSAAARLSSKACRPAATSVASRASRSATRSAAAAAFTWSAHDELRLNSSSMGHSLVTRESHPGASGAAMGRRVPEAFFFGGISVAVCRPPGLKSSPPLLRDFWRACCG